MVIDAPWEIGAGWPKVTLFCACACIQNAAGDCGAKLAWLAVASAAGYVCEVPYAEARKEGGAIGQCQWPNGDDAHGGGVSYDDAPYVIGAWAACCG